MYNTLLYIQSMWNYPNVQFQATEPQLTVLLYNAERTLVHRPLVEKGLADYA